MISFKLKAITGDEWPNQLCLANAISHLPHLPPPRSMHLSEAVGVGEIIWVEKQLGVK